MNTTAGDSGLLCLEAKIRYRVDSVVPSPIPGVQLGYRSAHYELKLPESQTCFLFDKVMGLRKIQ